MMLLCARCEWLPVPVSLRWHGVHHPPEAAPHLPALVPPHHRAALLLVLLQGPGGGRRLVHDHELRGPLSHVHVLRGAGGRHAGASSLRHDHHGHPDHADGDGPGRPGPGVPLDARGALSVQSKQRHMGLSHVPQLPGPVCRVLLQHLPQRLLWWQRIQGRVVCPALCWMCHQ